MKKISINDAAKEIGVTRQTLFGWIKKGVLPKGCYEERKILRTSYKINKEEFLKWWDSTKE